MNAPKITIPAELEERAAIAGHAMLSGLMLAVVLAESAHRHGAGARGVSISIGMISASPGAQLHLANWVVSRHVLDGNGRDVGVAEMEALALELINITNAEHKESH